jgi:hypothetical protein
MMVYAVTVTMATTISTEPNVSAVSDIETARTNAKIAGQRADHLMLMNCESVLELCVGPSASTLYRAYDARNIDAYFNDIELKWKGYSGLYGRDQWEIGDCLTIFWGAVDAVVFAPPLSRGCSGKREDSLMIDEVTPSYYDFLTEWAKRLTIQQKKDPEWNQVAVLVLPARCLATKEDRDQYHKLLGHCSALGTVEAIEMIDGCRKYVDVYIRAR